MQEKKPSQGVAKFALSCSMVTIAPPQVIPSEWTGLHSEKKVEVSEWVGDSSFILISSTGAGAFSILTSGIAAVTAVLLPFSTSVAMANVLHLICASALAASHQNRRRVGWALGCDGAPQVCHSFTRTTTETKRMVCRFSRWLFTSDPPVCFRPVSSAVRRSVGRTRRSARSRRTP